MQDSDSKRVFMFVGTQLGMNRLFTAKTLWAGKGGLKSLTRNAAILYKRVQAPLDGCADSIGNEDKFRGYKLSLNLNPLSHQFGEDQEQYRLTPAEQLCRAGREGSAGQRILAKVECSVCG